MYTSPQVFAEDYSCILEPQNDKGGLFIGNLQSAQNIKTLQKHNIKAVLTSCKGNQPSHPKHLIPYTLYIPGQDHESFDLSKFFHQGVSFIHDCLQRTNILVHCLGGVSRSVTLVLAYFVKHWELDVQSAIHKVKSKRKIICPNDGFLKQLQVWERQQRAQKRQTRSPSPVREGNNLGASYTRYSLSPTKNKYADIEERLAELREVRKGLSGCSPSKNPEIYSRYASNRRENYSPPKASYNETQKINRIRRYASINTNYLGQTQPTSRFNESQIRGRAGSQYARPDYSRNDRVVVPRAIQERLLERKGSTYDYNPLENIQNRRAQINTSTADIDKKIQEIRKKYQQYSSSLGTVGGNRPVADENSWSRRSSVFNQQPDFNIYDRNNIKQGLGGTHRLKRLTSLQEY